jgi:hypothetical protein
MDDWAVLVNYNGGEPKEVLLFCDSEEKDREAAVVVAKKCPGAMLLLAHVTNERFGG